MESSEQWKKPGCLGYIGTPQLCGDYKNKPVKKDPYKNHQDSMEKIQFFFVDPRQNIGPHENCGTWCVFQGQQDISDMLRWIQPMRCRGAQPVADRELNGVTWVGPL